MSEFYILSSLQANNGLFCFDCEEREGRKRMSYISAREKRKRERSDNDINQMPIICFSEMERKDRKERR